MSVHDDNDLNYQYILFIFCRKSFCNHWSAPVLCCMKIQCFHTQSIWNQFYEKYNRGGLYLAQCVQTSVDGESASRGRGHVSCEGHLSPSLPTAGVRTTTSSFSQGILRAQHALNVTVLCYIFYEASLPQCCTPCILLLYRLVHGQIEIMVKYFYRCGFTLQP